MKKGQLEYHLLVLVTLSLVAAGIVMVYSATAAAAQIAHGDPNTYLKRHAVYALVGVVVLLVASRLDFRVLRTLSPALVLGSAGLCAAVLVLADPVNGARRWLSVGAVTFQPSELAKLALAVWVAAYLARRPPPRTIGQLARPLGLVAGVFCLLILAEPDLGTTITIIGMLAAVLVVAGTPASLLAGAAAVVGVLGFVAVWLEPYRRARVLTFLDPWRDAEGSGFQTVQAMISLGSGGFLGSGLGQGVAKINYLPEAHTDMIFAVIGEELGLIGVAAVICAFAVFAYAGLRIAMLARDPFGKRLATGLTALICGQASINVAAVLGLAPLTGIPLPFVSWGGTSLVVSLASVGILLNIAADVAAPRRARVPDRSRGDGRARAAVARGGGRAAAARGSRDARRVARSHRGAAGS